MTEYIVDGAQPNSTVLKSVTRNGYEHEMWLPVREEIVRCKDCKHYREGRHGFPNRCRLWFPNIDLDEVPNILPYGFCAWGERRDA